MAETRPSRSDRLGLRARLLWAVAIAASPVLLLASAQAVAGFRLDTDERRALLSFAAAGATARAHSIVGGAEHVLSALETQPDVRAGGETCDRALARAATSLPYVSNIVRVAEDGVLVCAAVEPSDDTVLPDAVRALRGRPDARFWVSRLLVSEEGGRTVIVTALRHREGDGALLAVFPTAPLDDTIAAARLPEDASVALADRSGRIIAGELMMGLDRAPQEWILESRGTVGRLYPSFVKDGLRCDLVIAPLVGDDVFVVLAAPTLSVWAWARLDLFTVVIAPLLVWLLVSAAVWIAADRFVLRWLDDLRRIALLYGAGKLTSPSPERLANAPAEIIELATAMGNMAHNIERRETQLSEAVVEKETLLKEIHHRVKNNLQIIASLLSIQLDSIDDPVARQPLEDARGRINALSMVHHSLYEAEELRAVNLRPFLTNLVQHLAEAFGAEAEHVAIETTSVDVELPPDAAVPLALWTVEAVTNAMKHAFSGRAQGRIWVTADWADDTPDRTRLALTVDDDGLGPSPALTGKRPGIGQSLMSAFARQLGGQAERSARPGGGARQRLVFAPPA